MPFPIGTNQRPSQRPQFPAPPNAAASSRSHYDTVPQDQCGYDTVPQEQSGYGVGDITDADGYSTIVNPREHVTRRSDDVIAVFDVEPDSNIYDEVCRDVTAAAAATTSNTCAKKRAATFAAAVAAPHPGTSLPSYRVMGKGQSAPSNRFVDPHYVAPRGSEPDIGFSVAGGKIQLQLSRMAKQKRDLTSLQNVSSSRGRSVTSPAFPPPQGTHYDSPRPSVDGIQSALLGRRPR